MSFEMHKGTVTLGGGHSLIIGNVVGLNALADKLKEETESSFKTRVERFGLFNIATPDTTTFYKDVSAEDLKPEESDYIRPLFRGLSETIVRKNYDPIDFGTEKGVLKASMGLIVGQTVFSNHEAFVGNEKGVVNEVMWDEGYTHMGVKIPAGFNMEFLIDGKVHTKLARELMAPRPIVHSNSVTVQFGWKQSHPKMDLNEFRSKVGTFDAKGEMYRRVVNEIYGYHETSLVAHGADPFAQILDKSGKIINPKYAHGRDSFSEAKHITQFFAFDWKESLSEPTIPKNHKENENADLNNTENMKGLKGLILLAATLSGIKLSTADANLSEDEFSEKFDLEAFNTQLAAAKLENVVVSELQSNLETLKTEKTGLEGQVATLTTEKADLAKFKTDNEAKLALIAEAESFKAEELAEVLRLHTLINDNKEDADMRTTFEASSAKTLGVFKKQYTKELNKKFPSKCGKCGSEEIVKASAKAGEDDDDDKGPKKPRSMSELKESLQEKIRKTGATYTSLLG